MESHRTQWSENDLLPPKIAAVVLGGAIKPISLSTLVQWRDRGTGPAFKRVGNSIRYRYADLIAFIQSSND